MSPCTHGMPHPASCVECMADGNLAPPPPPPRLVTIGPPFTGRYDDHCNGCNTGIHEGQLIVKMSDGTYRHSRCWDGP